MLSGAFVACIISEYFMTGSICSMPRTRTRGGSRILIWGGGAGGKILRARTHITSAEPNFTFGRGACRARLRALEALGLF